ncbi:MAG: Holliday junction resolvase RuvX [Rhodospirillales bacterium]|nr:Holliday junction resolvase RuvX [Rhodospirillales bacterium]
MTDRNLAAFKKALAPGQRLLGIDHGSKTLGLALSDVSRMIATPMETLIRAKFAQDAERLVALIEAQGVGGLVIGLPIEMDGAEGPRCQSARQFARNLAKVIERPVLFWDERLSTAAVLRMMVDEADLSRAKRARAKDKMAAAWILQGALDALARTTD